MKTTLKLIAFFTFLILTTTSAIADFEISTNQIELGGLVLNDQVQFTMLFYNNNF